MPASGILWRDTARPVRVGFLDARALSGLAVWLVHMSAATFALSVLVIALFVFLERFGITPPAAWRLCRQSLLSPLRPARDPYFSRRMMRP